VRHKLAPLSGVVFFLLLLAGVLTGDNLKSTDSGTKVIAYYTAHRGRLQTSGFLISLAVFVGVVFYGLLRDYLRRSEGVRGLTATAFGGVVLFAASGCLGAGCTFALADSPSRLTTASAQTLNLIKTDGNGVFSSAGIAVLLFAFGLAIVRSGLLPKWLGWVAFPFVIVALIPPTSFFAFIATGLWTLIVSVTLYQRQAAAPAAVAQAAAPG